MRDLLNLSEVKIQFIDVFSSLSVEFYTWYVQKGIYGQLNHHGNSENWLQYRKKCDVYTIFKIMVIFFIEMN